MAQIIKPLKVDLSQESSYVYMKVKEGDDNSRKYQVIFTDRGIPINDLTGRELVTLYLAESGSEKSYASQDCTWENGLLYITFTSNMLSHVGDIDCSFVIIDAPNNTIISSRIWHINVQRSLIDYEGLIKSEDFNTLNNLIKQALMIPDLIATFNVSQDEINALIVKINADITAYQQSYDNFNTDATELIATLRSFLAECQTAENMRIANENTRIANENLRQTNTATAIKNTNAATAATKKAISDAEEATAKTTAAISEAYDKASYAYVQAEAARAATEALHYEMIDMDGGDAHTDESAYESDFNGGGA